MSQIIRFSVSLEADLLESFDRHCAEGKFATRSEAVHQLIREKLTANAWANDSSDAAASLTVVYDHHKRELVDRLLDIQHDFQALIVSVQHIHLDHAHCLEIIVVKGRAGDIRRLHDRLQALKGVKHAALSMTTTGKKIG